MTKLEFLFSIPKSIYVSYKLCGFVAALKLAIIVKYNVKLLSLKGHVECENNPCFKMITIGFGNVGIFDSAYERTILQIDGTLVVIPKRNSVYIGHGSRICALEKAKIKFGTNFCNTAKGTICCVGNIDFGNNVLTSWDTLIMDTDWHSIQDINTLEIFSKTKPISIGNDVWIGTRAVILKGTTIPDNCIIGANSLITKSFDKTNTIIAGNPAKVVKENIKYIE